jgi:Ca2+-binding RTX toxin-like protein
MAVIRLTNNDDFRQGTNAADTISGFRGDDTLLGRGGNDEINADDGDDEASGGTGNDTLNGGPADDVLDGGAGTDALNGEGGNDVLRGGADADTLNGFAGNDVYFGGSGGDRFIWNPGDGVFVDTIEDFEVGSDELQIDIVANESVALTGGDGVLNVNDPAVSLQGNDVEISLRGAVLILENVAAVVGADFRLTVGQDLLLV